MKLLLSSLVLLSTIHAGCSKSTNGALVDAATTATDTTSATTDTTSATTDTTTATTGTTSATTGTTTATTNTVTISATGIQFGHASATMGPGRMTTDPSGNLYVFGKINASALNDQTSANASNCFMVKYSASGTLLFTKLYPYISNTNDNCGGVLYTTADKLYVWGTTTIALPTSTLKSTVDLFFAELNPETGAEILVNQSATGAIIGNLQGTFVSVVEGKLGDLVAFGGTFNSVGSTSFGDANQKGFITKINPTDLSIVDASTYYPTGATHGTSVIIRGVVSHQQANHLYFTGICSNQDTCHGVGGGGSYANDSIIFNYNLENKSAVSGIRVLSTNDQGMPYTGIINDANDNIYASRGTSAAMPGQTQTGTMDCVISKFDSGLSAVTWHRQFGHNSASCMSRDILLAADHVSLFYGTSYNAENATVQSSGNFMLGKTDFSFAGDEGETTQFGPAEKSNSIFSVVPYLGNQGYAILGTTNGDMYSSLVGTKDMFIRILGY